VAGAAATIAIAAIAIAAIAAILPLRMVPPRFVYESSYLAPLVKRARLSRSP
jgi:hypothetical protein